MASFGRFRASIGIHRRFIEVRHWHHLAQDLQALLKATNGANRLQLVFLNACCQGLDFLPR
jgi:hypothetical protein